MPTRMQCPLEPGVRVVLCLDPDHDLPEPRPTAPGIYVHVCPTCDETRRFAVCAPPEPSAPREPRAATLSAEAMRALFRLTPLAGRLDGVSRDHALVKASAEVLDELVDHGLLRVDPRTGRLHLMEER